ncbi:MAG: tail fiber domain-containing protein [Bacteriovoracaceae bacterium]|nr:tail fiber domain-containing protein [Bacteriovoracaceae bacterium]
MKHFQAFLILPVALLICAETALAGQSLSYSGRLVNSNGSPVIGPVNLKAELAYTNASTVILCSDEIASVPLANGVFHIKLELDCTPSTLVTVLANTPANESVAIRITDQSNSKVYSFQALHSIPFSLMSEMSKQIVQMSATEGQILTWDDTAKKWVPRNPVGTGNGSVTAINTGAGLIGGPISTSGTIAIDVEGVTSAMIKEGTIVDADISPTAGIAQSKIANLGTDLGNKEDKLPTGGATTDYLDGAKAWQNFDQSVRGALLLGLGTGTAAPIADTNNVMEALENLQAQILSNDTAFDGSGQWSKTVDKIYYNTDNVGIGTANPNEKLDVTGNIALSGKVRFKDSGTNYVELKAPVTIGSTVTFTLPGSLGTNGQVLRTDASGNLSWVTVSTDSSAIVDGSIVDADIAAGANIAQSKIAGLSTSLTNLQNSIASLTTDNVAEGSTNLYFTEPRVLGTDLAGLNTTAGAVTAADTMLSSIGKLVGNIAAVSTAQSNYVLKAGDTMSGNLLMGGYTVTGLAAPLLDSDAATKLYVDTKAAGASQWTTSGTKIYYDSGNVGIGTTNPATKVAISGTNVATNFTTNNTTGVLSLLDTTTPSAVGVGPKIVFGSSYYTLGATMSAASIGSYKEFAPDNGTNEYKHSLVFNTSNNGVGVTEKMRITSAGNVGVGTTSPGGKLHIEGNRNQMIVQRQNGIMPDGATYDVGGIVYRDTHLRDAVESNPAAYMKIRNVNTNGSFPTSIRGTQLEFGTADGNDGQGVSASTKMTITPDGNVGIGTITPINKLDVTGDIGLTGKLRLKSDNANYVELKSPTALAATTTYTFPATAGTSGYVLTTDGAGALSWSAVATTGTAVGGDLTGTIANAQLGSGVVGSTEIADLSITNGDIANNTINYSKLFLVDGDIPQAKVNGLVTALAGKEPTITAGVSSQYRRGDKTWQTLNTSVVPEGTNLYFTDARVSAALMSSYAVGTALPLATTDTLNQALGKLEAQIIANDTAFDGTGQWGKNGLDVYYNAGKVAVGATVPTYPLDVTGDIRSTTRLRVGANNASITTAGNDISLIDANGNTAFRGTRSTSAWSDAVNTQWFQVGNTGTDYVSFSTAGGGTASRMKAQTSSFQIAAGSSSNVPTGLFEVSSNTTGLFNVLANGNVGIGTTAPGSSLTVAGAASEATVIPQSKNSITLFGSGSSYFQGRDVTNDIEFMMGTSTATEVFSGSITAHDYALRTGNNPRVTIKHATGNVGIGTTAPSEMLHVNGKVLAVSYEYTSDERLKKNIQTIPYALETVNQLSGVTFDWRVDEFPERNMPKERTYGFIAQEVEKHVPELVSTGKDGFKSVQYGNITALLVEAIKELFTDSQKTQKNQIALERKIASLEERNKKLQSEMEAVRKQHAKDMEEIKKSILELKKK